MGGLATRAYETETEEYEKEAGEQEEEDKRNRILRRKRRNDSRNLLLLLLMPLVPWAPRLEHFVVAVGGCRLLSDPRAASR